MTPHPDPLPSGGERESRRTAAWSSDSRTQTGSYEITQRQLGLRAYVVYKGVVWPS